MVEIINSNPVAQLSRYELRHLAAHLEQSGRIDDLHRLLALETSEHRNAWFETKDASGDLQDYLDDVVRAWRLVEQERKTKNIGKELLYALCYASTNSLMSNIPSKLLLMLLQHGIWTEEKIINSAQLTIYEQTRGETFALIIPFLSPEKQVIAWKEMLATIREIPDHWKLAEWLVAIAASLPEETLEAALELSDERSRVDVLVAVAPHMPHEVLAVTRELSEDWYRAKVLAAVASQLPHAALEASRGINEEWNRAEVLIAVAETKGLRSLTDGQAILEELLAAARGIRNAKYQADVLIAVASNTAAEGQPAIWEEALLATRRIGDSSKDDELVERLVAIALHLPEENRAIVLKEALTVALRKNWSTQVRKLAAIAPHLPHEVLSAAWNLDDKSNQVAVLAAVTPFLPHEVFAVAGEIEEASRAKILVAVAPHLPNEALLAAQEIDDEEGDRSQVLTAIAPYLPHETLVAASELREDHREEVLLAIAPRLPHEVLTPIRKMRGTDRRERLLLAAAAHLPNEEQQVVVREVLTSTQAIHDEEKRAELLVAIALNSSADLQEAILKEALMTAREGRNDDDLTVILIDDYREATILGKGEDQAKVLISIAPNLPKETLTVAQELEDEEYKAKVLVAITPYLPKETLSVAQEIENEEYKAKVLIAVAPYLPQETLTVAQELEVEEYKAKGLATVSPYLQPKEQMEVLEEALLAAQEINDARRRVGPLVTIAKHVPTEKKNAPFERARKWFASRLAPNVPTEKKNVILEDALAAAREIESEHDRSFALANIAPHLPHKILEEARKISWDSDRVRVLVAVASQLPHAVLEAAREMNQETSRAEVLVAVAEAAALFSLAERHTILKEVLTVAREISYAQHRAEVLVAVASNLLPEDKPAIWKEALLEARKIENEVRQVQILLSIVPHSPVGDQPTLWEEVLELVQKMEDTPNQLDAFSILIPHLSEEKRLIVLRATRENPRKTINTKMFAELCSDLSILSQSQLYKEWQEVLSIVSKNRTRSSLFEDIKHLLPIVKQLGGNTAVRDTWHAVQTVSTWWP